MNIENKPDYGYPVKIDDWQINEWKRLKMSKTNFKPSLNCYSMKIFTKFTYSYPGKHQVHSHIFLKYSKISNFKIHKRPAVGSVVFYLKNELLLSIFSIISSSRTGFK